MQDKNDKFALRIAVRAYAQYWGTEFSNQVVLNRTMQRIRDSIDMNDTIGLQARIMIMLVPAMIIEKSIAGTRKYFDELVETSTFTYSYDEETWEESMLAFIEAHEHILNDSNTDVTLEDVEKALRFILITSSNYYDVALKDSVAYSYAYILPLEMTSKMADLNLGDVITSNKTVYAAIDRSKHTHKLQTLTECTSPKVDTYMDFAKLLWCYKLSLASGFISYNDAVRVHALLNEGAFESHETKTQVPIESLLDFPVVSTGDVEFGDN